MKHNYGFIFKNSRENADLTQEEAAELLDKSIRTISDYENNKTLPPVDVILDMTKVYEDELLLFKLADPKLTSVQNTMPSRGVLTMLDVINKATKLSSELIAIACDDKIEDHELHIFNEGCDIGDEMIKVGMILKTMDKKGHKKRTTVLPVALA
ncbi:MAG: helix-turn-helix domain-containing protein [Cellulosilyticaceae bacterium]